MSIVRMSVCLTSPFATAIRWRVYGLKSAPAKVGLGNAKLFGALPDLGLSGQDWNTALSIFFVTYAFGGV